MTIPIHRDTDPRVCGATTTVVNQSNVFANSLLVAVYGDTNSHGAGGFDAINSYTNNNTYQSQSYNSGFNSKDSHMHTSTSSPYVTYPTRSPSS